MSAPLVYIAGPITLGNREFNVEVAVKAAKLLQKLGFAPVCPQLSYYAERDHGWNLSLDEWLDIDFPILDRCDAVLRIPGESKGADREVARAKSASRPIPVFQSIPGLLASTLVYQTRLVTPGEAARARDIACDLAEDCFAEIETSQVELSLYLDSVLQAIERSRSTAGDLGDAAIEIAKHAVKAEPQAVLNDAIYNLGHRPRVGTGSLKDSGKRAEFGTGAQRDVQEGKGAFDLLGHFYYALCGVAQVFEAGNAKYPNPEKNGRLNCEYGIPTNVYANSGLRHVLKYIAGYRDEPHLFQAIWNFICLAETEARVGEGRLPRELLTLPEPIPGEPLPTEAWQTIIWEGSIKPTPEGLVCSGTPPHTSS